jgi:hypothetical protein
MSLCRAALLASNLAIANVNAIQLATLSDTNTIDNAMDTTDYVDWVLEHQPTRSNLGGEGPDENEPEEMRIPGVKEVNGVKLDLVVRINEDKQDRPYEANNAGNNKVRDGFGITNVKSGGVAHLNFRFTAAGEDATWYPSNTHKLQFKFTIYDVDESSKVKEEVWFDTPVDHLYLAENHSFHEICDDGNGGQGGNNTLENPLYFVSTDRGNGEDNPTHGPNELSPKQERRAITVAYQDKSEWNITFKATMIDPNGRKKGGRNFMWAGGSHVPDAQACTEWAEPTFPWAICDKNNGSNVVTNNLGGLGPHKGENTPEEIRYAGVATVHGHQVARVVKAAAGYEAWDVSRNQEHSDASIQGCFGAINVRHESKATLTFTFVQTGTDDPAKFDHDDGFGFTVYDLDNYDNYDNEERVRFITKPHSWMYPGNEVEKIEGQDGTFKSTATGNGTDNVLTKDDARDWDQIRKSVRVMYQGIASWKVMFDVRGGTEGRNFLFGGCLHLPEDVRLGVDAHKHVGVYHVDHGDHDFNSR